MGTTCTHKPKGTSVAEFFLDHGVFRWSDDLPHTYRVLDTALVNLTEFYAAVEMVHKETGARRVWAAIIKVTFLRPSRGGPWSHNFCYKDMDESMGPFQTNCPERILKLLTPTDCLYAQNWRDDCWAKIEAKKARPKIVAGMQIKYGGTVYIVEKSLGARGLSVRKLDEGWSYRMNRRQVARAEVLCQSSESLASCYAFGHEIGESR